jgi:hypothetical protein
MQCKTRSVKRKVAEYSNRFERGHPCPHEPPSMHCDAMSGTPQLSPPRILQPPKTCPHPGALSAQNQVVASGFRYPICSASARFPLPSPVRSW